MLKAYDKIGGSDLSWSTAAYVLCTGETASNILRYKFSIVALQIDARGWSQRLKSLRGKINEIRLGIEAESKKMLQKMIDDCEANQSDIPTKFYKFVKIFPRLGLKFPNA